MPLSASPRLPATEMSQDSPQEDCKVSFSAEVPARPQNLATTSIHPDKEDASTQPHKVDMPMVAANQAILSPENSLAQHVYMPFNPQSMQWSSPRYSTPRNFPQNNPALNGNAYSTANPSYTQIPHHARNSLSFNANQHLRYASDFDNHDLAAFPRNMTTSYPPSAFFHSPPDPFCTQSLPDTSTPELAQTNDDYDMQYAGYIKQEDQLEYTGHSPYSKTSRASTPYSTGYEDEEPIDKEQPYAQLIYRALLDAPQHTMVLRDIYDWFRLHTDKAAQSETKGWQNSIRHNLSMNGAFEKVDSPADASIKGFMWRLTEDALREGVKSTTRYRSKAPNKRSSTRAQPLPQRQASGAKGGHAARRAASQRRSQRMRDTYHAFPRSEPYPSPAYRNGNDWPHTNHYTSCPSPIYSPRIDSPYSQSAFSPYHPPKDNLPPFSPMPGLASHLMSPPRSYASSPTTASAASEPSAFMTGDVAFALHHADNQLFDGSPTPPAEEPITPVLPGGVAAWGLDGGVGVGVYDDLARFGRGL